MQIISEAKLPTKFGKFRLIAFKENGTEHLGLVRGDVKGKKNVPLRIHSQCLTGDTLGSLRCDCRDQLETAMEYLGKKRFGILIYLKQEGRGIGLGNKVKAYRLQDEGYDTAEANKMLGFKVDERDYSAAAKILGALGIKSVNILTNNPDKIAQLEKNGIVVGKRTPIIIEPSCYSRFYLRTKKKKLGHLL